MGVSIAEIVTRVTLKMIAIWGSLALVALPVAKVLIEVAYEIWRDRNERTE